MLLVATSATPLAPVETGFSTDGVTGMTLRLAVVPPHSGPQLRTYTFDPSGEKTALIG